MEFSVNRDVAPLARREIKIGDVFPAKASGPKGRHGTRFWVVVSITRSQFGSVNHHLLGVDVNGTVVSTSSYAGWVMGERDRVGHCAQLADLKLAIEWEDLA